ncbi:hypothetical protein Ssi03_62620 [Sphaerisporangium siamense]|uniref:Uncharacterized protein n=1 Tax=Sphaerisporangium siamense TaxID=795645 RepID=A0A7W7D968_9ACTN|nr:hypothetical protein [Sphaerisporangium siamense]MBB4702570.1 hypothetical protein [Sphaerisporangium siamense]GII88272.1 hypothetical protein Ssi03_62620 [Sphaerisporangium siamense]
MSDIARAVEGVAVGVGTALTDALHGTTRWLVERWDAEQTTWVRRRSGLAAPAGADFARLGVRPYATSEVMGNLITNNGWTRLMNLLTNQGGTQALDATHVRIGVGNSNTAEAYTDTDLAAAAGASNRYFQPVSGAGTLGTRTLSFAATFGTADGNFAWNEFGLDITSGTAAGGTTVGATLFNRKAGIAQGTKASGQTWTATATLTFT